MESHTMKPSGKSWNMFPGRISSPPWGCFPQLSMKGSRALEQHALWPQRKDMMYNIWVFSWQHVYPSPRCSGNSWTLQWSNGKHNYVQMTQKVSKTQGNSKTLSLGCHEKAINFGINFSVTLVITANIKVRDLHVYLKVCVKPVSLIGQLWYCRRGWTSAGRPGWC